MMSRYWTVIVAGVGAFAALPAVSEPRHKSDAIVEFFIESAEMGAARGICIGTRQECAAAQPKPAGFDMLIAFGLDSADLTPAARDNLGEFASALKDDRLSAARFVVEGHTDASGSETYNLDLSERRAQAVTSFLLDQGVAREKVEAIGMGKTAPRTSDPFDAENRRVEMRIRLN